MKYLLDTNILSALIKTPQGSAAQRLAQVGEDRVATNVVVAGELLYGCEKKGSSKLTARVRALLSEIEVLPLTPEVAKEYGQIRAALERKGLPIGQNDLWIAAHAKTLGACLVTANTGEFQRIAGLSLENWCIT